MKPTQELIDVLRFTANKIEERPGAFLWVIPAACTCGTLVKSLFEMRNQSLTRESIIDSFPCRTWTSFAFNEYTSDRCDSTGLPMNFILKELHKIGIQSPQDIKEIEFIGGIINLDELVYTNPKSVISWLRSKAELLENEMQAEQTNHIHSLIKKTVKSNSIQGVSIS